MRMETKLRSAVLPHLLSEGQQSGMYQRMLSQKSEQQGKRVSMVVETRVPPVKFDSPPN